MIYLAILLNHGQFIAFYECLDEYIKIYKKKCTEILKLQISSWIQCFAAGGIKYLSKVAYVIIWNIIANNDISPIIDSHKKKREKT